MSEIIQTFLLIVVLHLLYIVLYLLYIVLHLLYIVFTYSFSDLWIFVDMSSTSALLILVIQAHPQPKVQLMILHGCPYFHEGNDMPGITQILICQSNPLS